ncbi:MAG: chromosome segregation protein SMC [Rhodospirillales bacterium CG15_BIG_FIL_POST_REV_8_21_14_020_66_15]|nr:MAG: chromosome segregation protein SMC [Rhodospirillales bacterium CG15_BIG_FIL_POST_REV_8_21_14_020_66_15]
MLNFKKLRVLGFKSFVDPTELFIEPGLTGVVGPNGCGKSNVVEALKWVMGETSAKQMRGSEMEDVIFSGTQDRPSRNIAEVTLHLDNASRRAPAQFNDTDELEVTRRIEREKGSSYRINGKDVRARDVQLLFADQATGARSTALVSQGRIGTVINAKPAQRRLLLEEAAGITGLHSRRHEAELRLRGAEANLERLDDILVTLDAQMNNLKKQARQATRYRNLSDHIRKAEATLFHILWSNAEAARDAARANLKEAEQAVTVLTQTTAAASTRQAQAAEGLPELRQGEAAAAAELQRLTLAREGMDEEEARVARTMAETRARLDQTARDRDREQGLMADAAEAVERLANEKREIETAQVQESQDLAAAAEARAAADEAVAEMDREVDRDTNDLAAAEARRNALGQRLVELENRLNRLAQRAADAEAQKADLESRSADLVDLAEADAAVETARSAAEAARQTLTTTEAARAEADQASEQAAQAAREKATELTALETEIRTLERVLATGPETDLPPMLDQISVDKGFEDALGAALGEDLSAPATGDDGDAVIGWRALGPMANPPALPAGGRALSEVVRGPAALDRRLSQIGIVDNAVDGTRLQGQLQVGQRLVSRAGGLWRWDGFTVAEGAETAAAQRLAQRNRLNEASEQAAALRTTLEVLRTTAEAAKSKAETLRGRERDARQALTETDRAFNAARDRLAEVKDRAAAVQNKLAALAETQASIAADQEESQAQKASLEAERAELPDLEAARTALAEKRTALAEKRTHQMECRSRHDQLHRASEARKQRLLAVASESQMWVTRRARSESQLGELAERVTALQADLGVLEQKPAEIAAKRDALLTAIQASEERRNAAADHLARAEATLAEADRELRQAEHDLSLARETRVRAEGAVEQADQGCRSLIERINDRLHVGPEKLPELAEVEEGKDLPGLENAESRVDRLLRERDTMGPVNLRAEQEMTELSEQITGLETEKTDLLQAIDKLRQGINELNREGRARLLASFEEVNEHFKVLFQRLFGGGRAHLELVESDDPLEAGLEIFASPPGKRLQVLSLLSGGEQALTALALLFGVFQTNPAPICVLDEVDAPLDDANVDRFCSMLDEMAAAGQTRFIVITHHRMTMARMHRLFGVTMQERGVSQLVSVDLQQAETIRESA